MPGIITISNSQNRWKDVYASAAKLDLTLRCNGEEKVKIMTSLGVWYNAELLAPTSAPTVSTLGTPGNFDANKHWEYRYVYVAKKLFLLVENAITGGASPAPRSNPSPSDQADSTVNTNEKRVSIPTSSAAEVSHIWIYRTDQYDDAAQAADFSAGGLMFWIGEVVNDPNVPAVLFDDDGSLVGQEQIENDNFSCPQFQMAVYADPFFYGFGNNQLITEVVVTSSGLITVTTSGFRWYDGRNGQITTLMGIDSGGFDGRGTFFFKWVSFTTAQLYNDIALTVPSIVSVTGHTYVTIRGPGTTLYRSKPRNPFSWGTTDLINDLQIPQLYAFSVGGGRGTCISVVPNVHLLKLDTEAPNKVYTLNLKNAGTPNFEGSLRSFADTYCVSNFHSQFSATLDRGQLVTWGLDTKNKAIVECDGAGQIPISSNVFKTLRDMSTDAHDRHYFHGGYHPRLELNCIFIRTRGSQTSINKILYQHGPTKQWGIVNCFDLLCSAQILDPRTNELKLFVGTETGFVGELFAEDKVLNWYERDPLANDQGRGDFTTNATPRQMVGATIPWNKFGFVGNWVTLTDTIDGPILGFARIANASSGIANADIVLNANFEDVTITGFPLLDNTAYFFVGLIESEFGKSFNGQLPFTYKKIEEFWSTWRNLLALDEEGQIIQIIPPKMEVREFYGELYAGETVTHLTMEMKGTSTNYRAKVFGLETGFPIDIRDAVTIIVRDRNYGFGQLMNYEIKVTPESDGNRS